MNISRVERKRDFIYLLIKYMKGIIIFQGVLSIVYLILARFHKSMVNLVVMFNLIMILGVFLSMIIHESAHFLTLRLCKVKQIGLDTSFFRVSVYTNEDIKGVKLMLVALAGVFSTTVIAIILMIINYFVESSIIKIFMWIYYMHLINILPVFGDGKMLLKSWLTMK